jgi:transcriptional regulator with XRE-family HTH domain
MNIGAKIKKTRLSKNYSQKHMADTLDISQSYYNKIENEQANLTVDKLRAIAEELKIDSALLLDNGNANFSNTIEINNGQVGINTLYLSYSEEERQLYKEQIKLLKEEVTYLKSIFDKFK